MEFYHRCRSTNFRRSAERNVTLTLSRCRKRKENKQNKTNVKFRRRRGRGLGRLRADGSAKLTNASERSQLRPHASLCFCTLALSHGTLLHLNKLTNSALFHKIHFILQRSHTRYNNVGRPTFSSTENAIGSNH